MSPRRQIVDHGDSGHRAPHGQDRQRSDPDVGAHGTQLPRHRGVEPDRSEGGPARRRDDLQVRKLPALSELDRFGGNKADRADAGHGLLSGPILAALRSAREQYFQPATTRAQRDTLAAEIGDQLATLFPGFAEQAKGITPTGLTQLDRENIRRTQDAHWLTEWGKPEQVELNSEELVYA